ncbi:MAG: hypothetical protein H8E32_16965 [Nitrospinae bacterium]|nr:hypothetical protein [Nitrospinota bacterium]
MTTENKIPSFDELNADQLKELIKSGSGKVDRRKNKKTKKLPLKDERRNTTADEDKIEVFF